MAPKGALHYYFLLFVDHAGSQMPWEPFWGSGGVAPKEALQYCFLLFVSHFGWALHWPPGSLQGPSRRPPVAWGLQWPPGGPSGAPEEPSGASRGLQGASRTEIIGLANCSRSNVNGEASMRASPRPSPPPTLGTPLAERPARVPIDSINSMDHWPTTPQGCQ